MPRRGFEYLWYGNVDKSVFAYFGPQRRGLKSSLLLSLVYAAVHDDITSVLMIFIVNKNIPEQKLLSANVINNLHKIIYRSGEKDSYRTDNSSLLNCLEVKAFF